MGSTEKGDLRREKLGRGVRGGGATFAWFELWVEDVSSPPYVLILLGGESDFAILDPLEAIASRTGQPPTTTLANGFRRMSSPVQATAPNTG